MPDATLARLIGQRRIRQNVTALALRSSHRFGKIATAGDSFFFSSPFSEVIS